MRKVRINEIAKELEVKSKTMLDALNEMGIGEKKTHSSSLEDEEDGKVRAYFRCGKARVHGAGSKTPAPAGAKPKIDWSKISKPGDVLRAIQQRKEEESAPRRSRTAWS